jgi:hypothetical protein
MESVNGFVRYPNFFPDGLKKEVIAICKVYDELL